MSVAQPFTIGGCVLSASEGRSFGTLGQNKRPREKIAKTGPAKFIERTKNLIVRIYILP